MTYATSRGLVWVLDNVKKRGGGGLSSSGTSATGLVSGPSSLQLPSGPPTVFKSSRLVNVKFIKTVLQTYEGWFFPFLTINNFL